jgi:group I intron endonuclease
MDNSLRFPAFLRQGLSGVYAIENRINHKLYIGSSSNIRKRLIYHYSKLRAGLHPNQNLQRDYDELGINAFLSKVLFRCAGKDFLYTMEEYFIQLSRPEKYNIYKFALPNGNTLPLETRHKISVGLKGNTNTKGHTLSGETKRKMSIALKGRVMSPETRAKMRAAKLGRKSNAAGKHWKVSR